ncbi:MAG: hypothetical protein IKG22_03780 [Atopobiaceae bacterium]|nr:hypothetical protein [Atopobiaceae bacterium]
MRGGRAHAGQSTVEYALVLLAFIGIVGALGMVWAFARGGGLVGTTRGATSHSFDGGVSIDLLQDLTCY